jgi:Zn-finger nucleic acid-binding protein
MTCPRCNAASLVELDRSGIAIDRCTRCRGIWLDRGELDKLIAADRSPDPDEDGDDDDTPVRGRRRRDDDDDGGRRGFLWSLFD